MKHLCVAGAALNQTPLDWENNLENLIAAVHQARAAKVAILCLPELGISGYGCEDAFFTGYVLDQSLESLGRLAPECEDIIVSVGLPMEVENCLFNVCALIQNKKVLGFVAKQQLAGDGVYYEPRWFKKWPQGEVVSIEWNGESYPFGDLIFEIDGIRIGFEICEDAWNGIRPAIRHYQNNVDLILNPSASHFAFGKTQVRRTLVMEASRAFTCAYVYSNLLGNDAGRLIWDGEILIAQGGRLLARNRRFSFNRTEILSAVIDLEVLRRSRKKAFNFDPEIPDNIVFGIAGIAEAEVTDAYLLTQETELAPIESKEEEFYLAETLSLFDYMRKSRSNGFVISLSGGADSSACAVLCRQTLVRAYEELGATEFAARLSYSSLPKIPESWSKWITCVYQGTENSGEATLTSARELASAMGIAFHVWNVQPLFDDYRSIIEDSIGRRLDWVRDDIPLQNIQARLRAPSIWFIANLNNALLITTSNRSEAAVGYATMDGDTAGSIAPLGGIDKAFLIHWLRWAEETLHIDALSYVNKLQPTAELRPKENTQTDEKDLMPYTVLDAIQKCAIRDYKSPLEVFKTLRGLADDATLKGWIRKFFTLWGRNQWKRERYAPSFHLDDENLDPKSWCRFPILNGGFRVELEEMDRFH